MLADGVYAATVDPKTPLVAPPREDVPPHLDLSALQNAAEHLTRAAADYEKAYARTFATGAAASDGDGGARRDLAATNRLLLESERQLLARDGLPGRPWFRHLLYAPGLYTGYGVKTMPGARESIEQRQWSAAEREGRRIAEGLEAEAQLIERATASLGAR